MDTIRDVRQAKVFADQEPTSDVWLRRALTELQLNGFEGRSEWETIGATVLSFARRDGGRWHGHSDEFVGAFVAAVISMFRVQTGVVVRARSPWGLAITRGRLAGRTAVGAQLACGLTNRDPVSHRVRFADVPRVLSFDWLVDDMAS